MVLTIDLITKKDAQLSVLWKLATKSKVSNSTLMEVNVAKACRSIRKLLVSNNISNRASLYVIAQLMYGNTVLYDKQVTLLFLDVEGCADRLKHGLANLKKMLQKNLKHRGIEVDVNYEPPKKRSKRILEADYDMPLPPPTPSKDFQANVRNITMVDFATPGRLQLDPLYFDEDDLPRIAEDEFRNYDYDGVEHTDRQSSQPTDNIEEIRNASSFAEPVEPFSFPALDLDVINQTLSTPTRGRTPRRFEPTDELHNVLVTGSPSGRRFNQTFEVDYENPQSVSISFEDELERRRARSFARENFLNSERGFDSLVTDHVVQEEINLDLVQVDWNQINIDHSTMKTPSRKSRVDNNISTSKTAMKNMMENYSSLVHHDASVLYPKKHQQTVAELLSIGPKSFGRTYAKELLQLYKSSANIEFDGSGRVSSEESEGQQLTLQQRNSLNELGLDDLQFGTTPIKAVEEPPMSPFDLEVPRNAEMDIQRFDDLDVRRFDDLANNNSILNNMELYDEHPLIASDAHQSHQPDSQSRSRFEMFDDSYVTPRKNIISPFTSPRKVDPTTTKDALKEKILNACRAKTPFNANFDDVVGQEASRDVAARLFYSLLELKKEQLVEVNQDEPFSSIEIRLSDQPDSEDLEVLANSE